MDIIRFQQTILTWYALHKRDFLPWRAQGAGKAFDPYKILVSEVMLQQTQVSRVLEKFPVFLRAFPNVEALADASLGEVLAIWQGMGYNRRAKFLSQAAKAIVKEHDGIIPHDVAILKKLPGIGEYTAGAIACFVYNEPVTFFDTNIRKVFIHFFFPGKEKIADSAVRDIAQKALYAKDPRNWHYALMDYGALVLSKDSSLLMRVKQYRKQSAFKGSSRYFRAKTLRYILTHQPVAKKDIIAALTQEDIYTANVSIAGLLAQLTKEGFVLMRKGKYRVAG